MKRLSFSCGFSLTELLVTIGILAIVGSVATIGATSYIKTARQNTLSQALGKIGSAFETCMTFNGFKGAECNTLEQIKYEKSPKHKLKYSSDQDEENICFELRTKGVRGCIQFQNGSILRKCLSLQGNIGLKDNSYNFRASCDHRHPGICCKNCRGRCEEGVLKAVDTKDCSMVTAQELEAIKELHLDNSEINSLKLKDFQGLTSVWVLDL